MQVFDAETAQALWHRNWREDVPTGEVGTRVLLENEYVRIWHLELEPGRTSPLHTHMNPYFAIIIQATELETAFADGTVSQDTDAVGDVVWFGLDDQTRTHTIRNTGQQTLVARVVELLH